VSDPTTTVGIGFGLYVCRARTTLFTRVVFRPARCLRIDAARLLGRIF